MKKKLKKAFTLIELMVVIAIIALLATGLSNFNFRILSDKQVAEDLANQIITEIETARDEIMTGKSLYDEEARKRINDIMNIYIEFKEYGENKEKNKLKLTKRYNIYLDSFFVTNNNLGVPLVMPLIGRNTARNKSIEKELGKGYINNIYCGKNFNKKLKIVGGDERNNYDIYSIYLPLFSFTFGETWFTNGSHNSNSNYDSSFMSFFAMENAFKGDIMGCSTVFPNKIILDKEIVIITGYNGQFSGLKFNRISGIAEKLPNNKIDKDGNYIP